jgi:SpoVK/Ycf46/Vps4 family AAA+-type ATPase
VRNSAGYSGRDIEKLCTEAIERMLADANRALVDAAGKDAATLRRQHLTVRPISKAEFDEAFSKIKPKTSAEALRRYEAWGENASA